jgi:hypothetical protein
VAGKLDVADCAAAGRLLAELHGKGILFRSIHLGNIVKTPTGTLGLIDIADLSCQPCALLRSQRLRNFQHMWRPDEDHDYLGTDHKEALLAQYLGVAPPRLGQSERFVAQLRKLARLPVSPA